MQSIRNHNSSPSNFKSIDLKWRFCSLLLFFAIFFGQTSIGFTNSNQLKKGVSQEINDLQFIDFFDLNHSPLQLPFGSVPNDSETLEELDNNEEQTDDDFNFLFPRNYSHFIQSYHSKKFLLSNISIQNKPNIPLFVLFSSWKSFLI